MFRSEKTTRHSALATFFTIHFQKLSVLFIAKNLSLLLSFANFKYFCSIK